MVYGSHNIHLCKCYEDVLKMMEATTACYHCGDPCPDQTITVNEKYFCCEGCKMVFQILEDSNLCGYYDLEQNPGVKLKQPKASARFDYLNDAEIRSKLVVYEDENLARVVFYIPQIHCASCLWLLENLYKLHEGVLSSTVQFTNKKVTLDFNPSLSIKDLVALLASIGYEPELNLGDITNTNKPKVNRRLFYQLGIAGFAFGNVMLLSFPDYLGFADSADLKLTQMFGYASILLALPVVFYSAQDYFKSAFYGLKQHHLNIDVPVSLGIAVLFLWSCYEIITGIGTGYFDSLAGLVFFLLIGKWYQNRSFQQLSFERDYRSYFPISVLKVEGAKETSVPLPNLKVGDEILIRSHEIIPADAKLLEGAANIDYSFVTGESNPVQVQTGDMLYAGGKQLGSIIRLKILKEVSQSYLSQLWSQDSFTKDDSHDLTSTINRVSGYFTPIILIVAALTFGYWSFIDLAMAIRTTAAVLIVACPCALALSTPFTYGNAMRLLGRVQVYLKSSQVIEHLANLDTIIFDKTGTITNGENNNANYIGEPLSADEKRLVASLVKQSLHPLSGAVFNTLVEDKLLAITQFKELEGKGIVGEVAGKQLRIGSANWLQVLAQNRQDTSAQVYVEIDGQVKGHFKFEQAYRVGLAELINGLSQQYSLGLISGDNDASKTSIQQMFGGKASLLFNQTPLQKLAFIKSVQAEGSKVAMIGDGLNDAGALKQSDVGISITENINNFSPACDVIMHANQFGKLQDILQYAKAVKGIVWAAFAISFLYNSLGLFFAVQGLMSPVFAAILMPVSSITIVVFTLAGTWLLAHKYNITPVMTKVTIPHDERHNMANVEGVILVTDKEVA